MAASRRLATLLACCCFAALCAAARAEALYPKDTKGAVEFCARPATKSLRCGLVSAGTGEIPLITTEQCPWCGSTDSKMPPTPADLKHSASTCTKKFELLSLACSGRYVARTVFKVLQNPEESKENCTYVRLLGPASGPSGPNVRCALQLPPGPPGTEEARALNANEGPCWVCGFCDHGAGCPGNLNTWYSDTVLAETKGCAFDRSTGYEAQRVDLFMNSNTHMRVAKFEACNDAGCFNPAYEDAKVKNARRCVNGTCPN